MAKWLSFVVCEDGVIFVCASNNYYFPVYFRSFITHVTDCQIEGVFLFSL